MKAIARLGFKWQFLEIHGGRPALCLLPPAPGLSGQIPGSLRVWFVPDWSSQTAGGTGPRIPAPLVQAGDHGWRLGIDAAGDTLQVLAVGELPGRELVSAPIKWTAGQWHQVGITWAPGEPTVLWVDGVAVGTGPELPTVVGAQLWLGGDPTGGFLAQGQLDELYIYDQRLDAAEIAENHRVSAPQVALGQLNRSDESKLGKPNQETLEQAVKDQRHPPPREEVIPGCGVWLSPLIVDESLLLLLLHNTLPGKTYRLETSLSPLNPDWVFFREVQGEVGPVIVEVDTTGPTVGFFRVVYEPEPMLGFDGMDFAETGIDPPDIAGAVGPNHILQILNSKMAIYDRTGTPQGNPVGLTAIFGSADAVDPRVLYDHRRNRWVASILERTAEGDIGFPTRKVYIAVSKSATPSYLRSDWYIYVIRFNKARADFDTLGMDSNGIYLTVFFIGTREHAVVALPKNPLYDGSYNFSDEHPFREWLPVVPPELTANIIQPAVNFDDTPAEGPAWFLAKGLPEAGPPYRGGAIYFRRLVWNGLTPQWFDPAWVPVGGDTGYRNYFDLDDAAVFAPQPGFDGAFNIRLGRIGSRLSPVFIRDGALWATHQVGLSGTQGGYTGDATGAEVDRSAAQWLKFQVNNSGTGAALSVAEFGRVFDPAANDPVWYQFPSIATMASGDAVLGFSGSGKVGFLGAFAAWKPSLSSQFGTVVTLRSATETSFESSGADYSTTCVDPSGENVVWTFQQYAKSPNTFGTYATQINCFK